MNSRRNNLILLRCPYASSVRTWTTDVSPDQMELVPVTQPVLYLLWNIGNDGFRPSLED